jgi:hypothetical protein
MARYAVPLRSRGSGPWRWRSIVRRPQAAGATGRAGAGGPGAGHADLARSKSARPRQVPRSAAAVRVLQVHAGDFPATCTCSPAARRQASCSMGPGSRGSGRSGRRPWRREPRTWCRGRRPARADGHNGRGRPGSDFLIFSTGIAACSATVSNPVAFLPAGPVAPLHQGSVAAALRANGPVELLWND